ncbi:MAG: hypothetical protein EXS05_20635 [Planctomycetaceae bacterium]|nr:hypothetical protein [Planctomycetaceae bacterium]
MKKLHSYAPSMGLTVSEALDQHAKEWRYKQSTLDPLHSVLLGWEKFSGNPKIRNVTDEQIDDFEMHLIEVGRRVDHTSKASNAIRTIVKRIRAGDLFVERQRSTPGKVPPVPTKIDGSLRSYFWCLYVRQRLRGRGESQKRNYEITIRHFARMLGHTPKLADLTNDNVGDLMQWLIDRGRGARTANKSRDLLLALWRQLAREQIVKKWPTVDAMPEPKLAPIAWTKPELSRLWTACEAQTGTIGNVPAALWWLALHCVAWSSAERIGSILMLTWGDLDLDGGFAKFRAATRKGKLADNVARLHPATVETLRQFPAADSADCVFTWTMCHTSLWNHYKRLLKSAGLPCDRAHKFHALRKSAATWFEIAGGNATELLMHSSRQVTKAYLDPRLIGRQHAADLLFVPNEAPVAVEGGAP